MKSTNSVINASCFPFMWNLNRKITSWHDQKRQILLMLRIYIAFFTHNVMNSEIQEAAA